MKILIASKVDPATTEQLEQHHELVRAVDGKEAELVAAVEGCDAIVFRSGVQINRTVMEASKNLSLLVRAGSGLDNVDVDYIEEAGLELVRIGEPGGKAVAELAFAFMLSLSRHLRRADRLTREGTWAKYDLPGRLVSGKTLGIVGCGMIGTRVGAMGAAWGMEVLGCRDPENHRPEVDIGETPIRLAPLEEVLRSADYISVHVPLTDATRGLLGAAELAQMKPNSYLINLSRGGVVDEAALLAELTTPGRLAGAATDVHEREGAGAISPLAHLDNVLLTPHMGAMAIEVQSEIGECIIAAIEHHSLTHLDGDSAYANSTSGRETA